MTKGIMVALSNPKPGADEAEFNRWYNEVHGVEVNNMKGFTSMTRYKAVAQAVPPGADPVFKYLAFYELDDIEQALKSLAEGAKDFDMSDTVDLGGAMGIAFAKIFSTKD